ncbi:Major facilitator superfamily domain general substrate transporter [Penicillium cf. griseofulvum]|nr:Major facilitator superfamily domain general substrate transporter [Penicillium cf. griseofulvum]
MRLRVQPPKVRAMVDPTAFKDPAYLGVFVILFYLSFFAEATRITDSSLAFYMVPIFNTASVFGRTIPNKLADRFSPFNLLVPAALTSGLLMFYMMVVDLKAAVIVMVVLSGFISGTLIGLPPIYLAILTEDKSKLGTRVDMGYAIIVLGVLASGPSSGAILMNGGGSLDWYRL